MKNLYSDINNSKLNEVIYCLQNHLKESLKLENNLNMPTTEGLDYKAKWGEVWGRTGYKVKLHRKRPNISQLDRPEK